MQENTGSAKSLGRSGARTTRSQQTLTLVVSLPDDAVGTPPQCGLRKCRPPSGWEPSFMADEQRSRPSANSPFRGETGRFSPAMNQRQGRRRYPRSAGRTRALDRNGFRGRAGAVQAWHTRSNRACIGDAVYTFSRAGGSRCSGAAPGARFRSHSGPPKLHGW